MDGTVAPDSAIVASGTGQFEEFCWPVKKWCGMDVANGVDSTLYWMGKDNHFYALGANGLTDLQKEENEMSNDFYDQLFRTGFRNLEPL